MPDLSPVQRFLVNARQIALARPVGADYRPFIGMQGRVVERDPRRPFTRVELDELPEGCSDRARWFPNERLD